jgi:hypothetical protein
MLINRTHHNFVQMLDNHLKNSFAIHGKLKVHKHTVTSETPFTEACLTETLNVCVNRETRKRPCVAALSLIMKNWRHQRMRRQLQTGRKYCKRLILSRTKYTKNA